MKKIVLTLLCVLSARMFASMNTNIHDAQQAFQQRLNSMNEETRKAFAQRLANMRQTKPLETTPQSPSKGIVYGGYGYFDDGDNSVTHADMRPSREPKPKCIKRCAVEKGVESKKICETNCYYECPIG